MKTHSVGALGSPRLGDQGRRRMEQNKRSGGGSKFAEGQFDRFFPGETPIWINISPYSSYTQEIWDRQLKAVIEVTTTWYETQKHFVPRNKGRTDRNGKRIDTDFICSCGAHKDKPCWGCAIRTNHFKMLDKIEEEKGFRPDKPAPISRAPQFSLAITVMEKIYAVPLREKDGSLKKRKGNGQVIYRYTPAPYAELKMDDEDLSTFKYQFGHRMHWTMGSEELSMLIEADDKMKNHCGNCASKLFATHMICPGCETATALPHPVSDIDLTQARQKLRTCSACGEKGPFMPKVECAECGDAVEGRLTSFDIRITRKKVAENKYVTEIVAIRVPGVPGNKEDHERAMSLIESPLNLAEIFATTPLDRQKYICGDELTRGLTPAPAKKDGEESAEEPGDTESYGGDDADDGDGNRSIPF